MTKEPTPWEVKQCVTVNISVVGVTELIKLIVLHELQLVPVWLAGDEGILDIGSPNRR